MSVLRIIDVSPVLYTGKPITRAIIEGELVETSKGYVMEQIAVGGICYLFNFIRNYANTSTLMFATDTNPTVRKEIDPEYKANRSLDREIQNQQVLVKKILSDCRFNVIFKEGYEADDVIYSLAKFYKKDFDHIYIHTSDSDLAMLVNDKVSIAKVKEKDKEINMNNYSKVLSRDYMIPYNCCNIFKMLYGDKSDNYKGIANRDTAAAIEKVIVNSSHFAPLAGEVNMIGDLIQSLFPSVYDKFLIAYPHSVEFDIDIDLKPDMDFVKLWGNLVCNAGYKEQPRSGLKFNKTMEYLSELFSEIGVDY